MEKKSPMRIMDATKKKSDGRPTKNQRKEICMAEVLPDKYRKVLLDITWPDVVYGGKQFVYRPWCPGFEPHEQRNFWLLEFSRTTWSGP